MKAKSIKGKSAEEINVALQQSLDDGFKPTLAVVFLSIKQDRDAVCNILDKEGITIFGATTHGEFVDEELNKESIAILLLDMKKEYFSIYFEEYPGKNFRETTRLIAQKGLQKFPKPAFLIAASNMETGWRITTYCES